MNRIRKFCQSGSCQLFSYIGDSDWLAVVRDQYGNLKYRYLYANGRPLRIDFPNTQNAPSFYYRYTARGDANYFVGKEGIADSGWKWFGAWGNLTGDDSSTGFYHWNAAW